MRSRGARRRRYRATGAYQAPFCCRFIGQREPLRVSAEPVIIYVFSSISPAPEMRPRRDVGVDGRLIGPSLTQRRVIHVTMSGGKEGRVCRLRAPRENLIEATMAFCEPTSEQSRAESRCIYTCTRENPTIRRDLFIPPAKWRSRPIYRRIDAAHASPTPVASVIFRSTLPRHNHAPSAHSWPSGLFSRFSRLGIYRYRCWGRRAFDQSPRPRQWSIGFNILSGTIVIRREIISAMNNAYEPFLSYITCL